MKMWKIKMSMLRVMIWCVIEVQMPTEWKINTNMGTITDLDEYRVWPVVCVSICVVHCSKLNIRRLSSVVCVYCFCLTLLLRCWTHNFGGDIPPSRKKITITQLQFIIANTVGAVASVLSVLSGSDLSGWLTSVAGWAGIVLSRSPTGCAGEQRYCSSAPATAY